MLTSGSMFDTLRELMGRAERATKDVPYDPKARLVDLNPDHMSIVRRSVDFLRFWPTDLLRGNASQCTVYYFDRNQVLVRDSNNSDWIYVVLKGSLSVIKKLKRVEPQSEITTPRKKTKLADTRHLETHRENRLRPLDRQRYLRASRHQRIRKNNNNNINNDHSNSHNNKSVDLNNNYSNKYHDNNSHNDVDNPTMSSLRRKFSPEPQSFKTPYELEAKLERSLPGYHNSVDRLASLDYDRIIDDHRSRLAWKTTGPDAQVTHHTEPQKSQPTRANGRVPNGLPSISQSGVSLVKHDSSKHSHQSSFLPKISANNKVVQPVPTTDLPAPINGHSSLQDEEEDDDDPLGHHGERSYIDDADDERWSPISDSPNERRKTKRKRALISKTRKGVYLAPSRPIPADTPEDSGAPDPLPPPSPEAVVTSPVPSVAETSSTLGRDSHEDTIAEKLAKLQIQYQRRVTDREGRKTIAEELDQKGRRDFRFTEVDLDPTVIQIQVLERGQYFGVTQLLFQDQPSLSVISNGAECLVLSKKLFLQHASEKCMRHLRQTESPFPSEEELSQKLQDVVNWQAARAMLYRKLESDIRRKQALRQQYLPFNPAEYCSRSGPT